jgi:hypothetical protein
MYRATARLVESQLDLAGQGQLDERAVAAAREVLRDTRRVLLAALEQVESPDGVRGTGPR